MDMRITLVAILLPILSLAGAQSITTIDENLDNDWPLFRDRIITATSQGIFFRMNESVDPNLYYSDGTNEGTSSVGYTFESGFAGSDVQFVTQATGVVVLGVTGSTNDILLFKDGTSDLVKIESGLNDLEGIIIIGRNVFYAAAKSGAKSDKLYRYNLDSGASEEFFSFDAKGVIAISTLQSRILAMGYKDGTNQLISIDPNTAESLPYFTFTTNPDFPRAVNMTESGDKVYFWYRNGTSEYSLYVTDGTEEGTLALKDNLDYYDEFLYATERYMLGANGTIVFRGFSQDQGDLDGDLYFSDGTAENTRVLNIEGEDNLRPLDFVFHEDEYYFVATTSKGKRLCRTNGTQEGTKLLADRDVTTLERYNNKIFLDATFGGIGHELGYWESSSSSIELAFDIEEGFFGSNPRELTATDDKLFLLTGRFDRTLVVYEEELVALHELQQFPLTVSPNPTQGQISISGDRIKRLQVYDMRGMPLFKSAVTTLPVLPQGQYILKAVNAEGKIAVKKIVVLP